MGQIEPDAPHGIEFARMKYKAAGFAQTDRRDHWSFTQFRFIVAVAAHTVITIAIIHSAARC